MFTVTVVSQDVHQREEVDVVPVLAGDGVQVPVGVDHPVRHRPLLLQGPSPGAYRERWTLFLGNIQSS